MLFNLTEPSSTKERLEKNSNNKHQRNKIKMSHFTFYLIKIISFFNLNDMYQVSTIIQRQYNGFNIIASHQI